MSPYTRVRAIHQIFLHIGGIETFPDKLAAALLDGLHPIKVFREHRAMTQAQLAAAIGTSPVYISQIERGERRAGRKLLLKLAKALNVERALLEQNQDA